MADPSETTEITGHDPPAERSEDVLAAVHELSTQVRSLREEVRSVRAQTRALPAVTDTTGWQEADVRYRDSLAWMSSLDGAARARPALPRLVLEIVFLAAVAVGCAIAKLDKSAIVGVMAGAWALVVLAEWTASRADRRRAAAVYLPLPEARGGPEDPAWFAPPVERTSLDVADDLEDTAAGLDRASA